MSRCALGYLGIRQQSEQNAVVFAKVRRREKPRHALRDTVATGLAECGVPIEDISNGKSADFCCDEAECKCLKVSDT